MRKNYITSLRILLIMLLCIVLINTNAQTGLNFQGVARSRNNVVLASQNITIRLTILHENAPEYSETRKVFTNAQGLFTDVIGEPGALSTIGNFATINWTLTPKFLKIEMDPEAGTNFITMGTTQFQYVGYAKYAKSVEAENIVGIVPVALGGTGATNLTGMVKGNGTRALSVAIAGIDYLLPTGSAAGLTNFPIFNQNTTGNAATATKLATARKINGVDFDGTADITITSSASSASSETQLFEKELENDNEISLTTPFSMDSTCRVYVNGTLLKPIHWTGINTSTLKLLIHTMKMDHIIIVN
jgi:hypothetical protein